MAPLTYLTASLSLLMVSSFAAADDSIWTSQVTITTAPGSLPTTATAAAWDDWQTVVTWPAGCESWANPCPPGAHIVGGSVAGGQTPTETATGTASYQNDFTSFTTMTDANGVITGMPSKATVPAGVTPGTTLGTAIKSAGGNSSITTTKTPSQSPPPSSFSTGSASQVRAVGSAALIAALGVIVALS